MELKVHKISYSDHHGIRSVSQQQHLGNSKFVALYLRLWTFLSKVSYVRFRSFSSKPTVLPSSLHCCCLAFLLWQIGCWQSHMRGNLCRFSTRDAICSAVAWIDMATRLGVRLWLNKYDGAIVLHRVECCRFCRYQNIVKQVRHKPAVDWLLLQTVRWNFDPPPKANCDHRKLN